MTESGDRLLNPEQKQVNPDNFYVVQGWMRTKLKLTGASLTIYAIIFGFSQDGKSYFEGTSTYLSEWSGVSTSRVYEILKDLIQRGLIEKREKELNRIKFCDYRVTQVDHRSTKLTTPSTKLTTPPVNKVDTHNINIKHNIQDNIYKKTNTKKAFTKPTLDEIKAYCQQKGISIDCEYFFDYYESNGWKVSNSPMKDWQATVRNWARRNTNWKKEGEKNGATPGKYAGLGRIIEV